MLSILIPVYNYDIRALVNTIHKQLIQSDIEFEIIVGEDSPKNHIESINKEIKKLKNTQYTSNKQNIGRVATRQQLAEKAIYRWLLFLDADVMPKSEKFIINYLKFINSNYRVIYGGFYYKTEKPDVNRVLRWKYGRSKEQLKAVKRNISPYRVVISANMLIKKQTFLDLNSRITRKGYGYDNYFGAKLKEHAIKIFHIDNEVIHLGLECNEIYLKKIESAIETLLNLYENNELKNSENSLLKAYHKLKPLGLIGLIVWLFKKFRKNLKSNILGPNPNIQLLQFYKLAYFCYIDSKP